MALRQSTAESPTADEQRPLGIDLPVRTKRLIIIGAMLGMFMAALEQSVVSPAMPQIVSDLGGLELYPWLVQSFIMAQVVTIPIAGTLSDTFGRKPVLLTGMTVFLIGSALCGFAPGIYELIAFRAVQGVGAAILMTATFSVVGDLYAPAERGRFIGLFGGVFALSSLIGAPLGGVLTEALNWRWVFWIMLFLGPVVLSVVAFKMPWLRPPKREFKIDAVGVVTLSVTLIPAMVALSLASQWGWFAPQTLGLFVVSAIGLLIFIRVEQRAEQPIVPLQLFKIQTIATAAVVNFFIGVGMMGVFVYLQFYLQVGIGVDAATAGLVMGPMILVSVTGSIVSGQIMSRTGRYKYLAVTGSLMMFGSMLLLSTMTRETTIPGVLGRMFMFGIGMGLMMPVMSIASQNAAPQKFLGIVSAFSQFFQQVGGVIGIGVVGALFNARLANGLMERLIPELVEVIEPEKLVDPIFRDSLLQDLGPEVWAVAEPQVQTAVATAITDNFLLAAAIVFIAVLAILRLREIPLRSGNLPAAVNVERPDQPSDPASISVSEQPRVIEFPILEPKSRTAGNGRTALLELHDLRLRSQVSGRAEPERTQAAAAFERPSVRRVMIAGAMIGAGVGLAISLVSAKNGTR
ncbi:MAG: MDR family MFS transporter [Chloroflexi bacterium]|nr:MDR family MFS transporter [Chloroflexota bacterium]MCY3697877.1 MDR family MFS transporter [Chloroflexota bacterium]